MLSPDGLSAEPMGSLSAPQTFGSAIGEETRRERGEREGKGKKRERETRKRGKEKRRGEGEV